MIERLRVDAVSAFRGLRSSPAPVIWAILTIAISAGLNLAVFALIDRAILSPPAHVAEPDDVFTLVFEHGDAAQRTRMTTTSFATFRALRNGVPATQSIAAWQRLSTAAVVDGVQVAVDAMLVSENYFSLLGVRPRLGAGMGQLTTATDGPAAVVASHGFWTRVFGSDPAAIGRRFSVRGVDCVLAGVMPPGFSGHSAARVDVWMPFAAAMQNTPGWDTDPFRNVTAIVLRLKAGQGSAVAAEQATAVVAPSNRRVTLSPLSGAAISSVERRIAYWLTGISVLVLLIGLANTATLMLVRGSRRRRDLAIRTALGATRMRLVTQAVLEATAFAAVATGVAILLSIWFDEAIRRVLMPSLLESAALQWRTLGVAIACGALTFVVAVIVAALQIPASFRPADPAAAMRRAPRRRAHAALLVVQTTLSMVLLAGAGVFGRSFYNLAAQDFGMRMDGVLLVEFEQGPGAPDATALFRAAIERVRALPGVERVAPVNGLPFAGHVIPPVGVPGLAESPSVDGQLPFLIPAVPELFDILDIRVIEGRRFTHADDRGAPVVIVNETMARTVWPGERAVGKCIRIGFDPSFDPFTATGPPGPPRNVVCREVIGVARDVRQRSVLPDGREERLMQYYVPFSQVPPPPVAVAAGGIQVRGLLVRVRTDVAAVADPIRRLVIGDRTGLPFLQVRVYSDLLQRQMRPWRLGTMLLSIIGVLALGVAAMGLYAAFAHVVDERRREMAIRIAIGADPSSVLSMILREGATLAVVGGMTGAVIAVIGGKTVESLLIGTAPSDPLVLAGAVVVLVVVGVAATFVPARAAAASDPNALLRAE